MFKQFEELTDDYTWPVVIKYPKSGGKVGELKLDGVFKRLKSEELAEAHKRSSDEIELGDGKKETTFHYDKAVNEVFLGFKTKNDKGEYVALPDELQEQALSIPGAYQAIFFAYGTSIRGEKAKN